jgi:1-acyl-sn-glycerol-3-phosphate acyltransferase
MRIHPFAMGAAPSQSLGSTLLRIPARTAGFVGLTFTLLAGYEAERARADSDRARDAVTYKWMHRYGLGLLRVYGLDVTARGPHVEAQGGCYPARDATGRGRLFVMNHRSMLDIFVNLAFFEANIVSRADLSRWPVIGLAARRAGTLFVNRSDKRSGAAVINAMCTAVERGRGVMVYPEGTTFPGDEVRPFRPGVFLAAARSGAEIVPVGIAYDGDATTYRQDEVLVTHLARISSMPRIRIGLAVGDAVRSDASDVDATKMLAHERVQALVRQARTLLVGAPAPEG